MAVRLPVGVDRVEVTAILARIALENGFVSHNAPNNGSIGHMLNALATGKAMIINLAPPKEDAPPDK